jgi:hypothetical protein
MKFTGDALTMREQITTTMSGPQTAGRWSHNRTEFNGDLMVEVVGAILTWAGPRWRGSWDISSHGSVSIDIALTESYRLKVTVTKQAQVSAVQIHDPLTDLSPTYRGGSYRACGFGRNQNATWGWRDGEVIPKPREYTAFIEAWLNEANAAVTDAQATTYHLGEANKELELADNWVARQRKELEAATERQRTWKAAVADLTETLHQQQTPQEV